MTVAFQVPARAAPLEFVDVTPSTQFYREISWLADREITKGWVRPDGRREFRPVTPINRDAMAAFLYRYAESPAFTAPATSPFVDITPTDPFYKEVTWAYEQQITTGWLRADGKREFRPVSPINRDAIAAFIYRFMGQPAFTAPTSSPFSDLQSSVQFYKEMTWLASKGITTGWDQAKALPQFRPVQPVNRDAMAAFLYRLNLATTGPTVPAAADASTGKPDVGTMPSGFAFEVGEYTKLTPWTTLHKMNPCVADNRPFPTLGKRVASRFVDWAESESYGSTGAIVFSDVGSAMAFMAEIRARAYCPSGEFEYWRPGNDPRWDEALVVQTHVGLWGGEGQGFLWARRGATVAFSWSGPFGEWIVTEPRELNDYYIWNSEPVEELLNMLG